ncbi:MAG: hypothetical protein R6W80_13830 [Haliea sp.]
MNKVSTSMLHVVNIYVEIICTLLLICIKIAENAGAAMAEEQENMNELSATAQGDLRITRDTPIGYQLQPISKRAIIQLMGSRLWGRFNPNHWDPDYAAATGLDAPIQTGEMSSAYIAEMCVNHFGEDLFRNARIVCKYIASTLANEVITTHGVVAAKTAEGGGYRFRIDVWCDNEAGEKKTVGWVEVDVGA